MNQKEGIVFVLLVACFVTYYSFLKFPSINHSSLIRQLNNTASTMRHRTSLFLHYLLEDKPSAHLNLPLNFTKRMPAHIVNAYKMFFSRANEANRISVKGKCPTRGFVTVAIDGRLGNRMSQYSTLYAFARIHNVIPVIHSTMKRELSNYFSGIRLVTFEDFSFECSFDVTKASFGEIQNNTAHKLEKETNWFITGSPHMIHLYKPYRKEIIEQFRFRKNYVEEASNRIMEVSKSHVNANVTFVGVHIRRGDYPSFLRTRKMKRVDSTYLKAALSIYREQFPNAVFLVVSDTIEWARKKLENEKNVYFVGNGVQRKPGADMATMTLCNHSIITQGTFSFWTGFLNNGQTIAPDESIQPTKWEAIP